MIPDIETIASLPFEQRIPALKKAGIISDCVLGIFSCGVRPIVIININGVKQPFYRSAHGTHGKTKGEWHVFFGFGSDKINGPLNWMVKAHLDIIEKDYNSQAIRYFRHLLNETLNWPHELDIDGKNPYFNPHIISPGTKEAFNKLVYGIGDRGIIWGSPLNSGTLRTDINKMDAAFQKGEIKDFPRYIRINNAVYSDNGVIYKVKGWQRGFCEIQGRRCAISIKDLQPSTEQEYQKQ